MGWPAIFWARLPRLRFCETGPACLQLPEEDPSNPRGQLPSLLFVSLVVRAENFLAGLVATRSLFPRLWDDGVFFLESAEVDNFSEPL